MYMYEDPAYLDYQSYNLNRVKRFSNINVNSYSVEFKLLMFKQILID